MYASKALTITYIIQSENINNADGILYFIGPPNSPPGKEITNLVAVRKQKSLPGAVSTHGFSVHEK